MEKTEFPPFGHITSLVSLAGLAFAALFMVFGEVEARGAEREPRFYNVGLVLKARADGQPFFEIGLFHAEAGHYRLGDRFAFDHRCALDRVADGRVEKTRLIALDPIPFVSLTDPARDAAVNWAAKNADYVNWQYGGVFGRAPKNLDTCLMRYGLYLQRKHAGIERQGFAKTVSPAAVRPEAPAR